MAKEPCADPVALPDRAMTQREVFTAWSTDRTNLEICEERRSAGVSVQ
ncbi:hypothetical protein ACJ4V0_15495 [Phreatobacter sp. HK31-P]